MRLGMAIVLLPGCIPQWPDGLLQDPDHDFDGDGFTEKGGDCDDDNATVHPDVTEVCGDGFDNDCADGDLVCVFEPGEPVDLTPYACMPFMDAGASGREGFPIIWVGDTNKNDEPELLVGSIDDDHRVFLVEVYSQGHCTKLAVLAGPEHSQAGMALTSGYGLLSGNNNDFAIGSPRAQVNGETDSGAVYVVTQADLQITSDLSKATTLSSGIENADFGYALATRTVDEATQLVVSAPMWEDNEQPPSVYLLNGPFSGSVGDVSAHATAVLEGPPEHRLGGALLTEDLSGDGDVDLLIADVGAGQDDLTSILILTGQVSGKVLLPAAADIDIETNAESYDFLHDTSMARAGDMDGDGVADLLVGAALTNTGGFVYLVLGSSTLESGDIEDLALASIAVPTVDGYEALSIAGVGDMNGDDHPDIAIGAHNNGEFGEGIAFLVGGPVAGQVDLETQAQIYYHDEDYISVGRSVAGFPDLLDGPAPDMVVAGAGTLYLLPGPQPGL